ncbi:heavy-metal-associated domain-containing protein [Microvirga lotononidis]|uniref:Copper chaperone n=1 Tax=Microvirga lotononidis TaxID=864069 RepID=I4YKS9_9HYPH|nr:cation transporter [Microvirga lotononidis]EIM24571.1 copper chaperone [Microvirga lotononidis]WQO26590.1 cation transporter [Microvirga lotononidis]
MYRFHVPDMSCGGCLRSVEQAIRTIDPQAEVDGNLENHVVTVASSQGEARLLSALEMAGFPAQLLSQQEA